jgi:cytochrome c551/c552
MTRWLVSGMVFGAMALGAVGDSARGGAVFEAMRCGQCHKAAELGRVRGGTPAGLAGTMWNHAPEMWAAMEKAGVKKTPITTQDAADLFAWFQAARYFERAGNAGNGKRLFAAKGCGGCHAKVEAWSAMGDAIELGRQMWNHAPRMQAEAAVKGGKIQTVTAAEMNDIAAYVSSVSKQKMAAATFEPASEDTGARLVEEKGCVACHPGAQAWQGKVRYTTAAEIAAAMWNHAARMKHSGEMRPEEMRRIVGYLWSRQWEKEGGDAKKGEAAFRQKGCAGCHGSSAPYLGHEEEASSFGMVAVLWQHGPEMLRQMKGKGLTWPRFEAGDMADVVGYLQAAK